MALDSPRLSRQVIRSAVLGVIKDNQNLQFAGMPQYVAQRLVNEKQITTTEPYVNEGVLHPADIVIINEIIWELLTQNVLAPGTDNGGTDFPFFRLTDYGRQCVAQEAILPHDYDNYLENIRKILTSPDDTFMLYLEESVQAFLKNLYISTTVNLGVAAERLVVMLVEAYREHLKTADQKKKYDEAIAKAKYPAAQFDEVYKRLEIDKRLLPDGLGDDLSMLKFIQEVIRTERNDAGHPSGRKFTRDEAMTYLLTFPSYLKIYQQIMNWL